MDDSGGDSKKAGTADDPGGDLVEGSGGDSKNSLADDSGGDGRRLWRGRRTTLAGTWRTTLAGTTLAGKAGDPGGDGGEPWRGTADDRGGDGADLADDFGGVGGRLWALAGTWDSSEDSKTASKTTLAGTADDSGGRLRQGLGKNRWRTQTAWQTTLGGTADDGQPWRG